MDEIVNDMAQWHDYWGPDENGGIDIQRNGCNFKTILDVDWNSLQTDREKKERIQEFYSLEVKIIQWKYKIILSEEEHNIWQRGCVVRGAQDWFGPIPPSNMVRNHQVRMGEVYDICWGLMFPLGKIDRFSRCRCGAYSCEHEDDWSDIARPSEYLQIVRIYEANAVYGPWSARLSARAIRVQNGLPQKTLSLDGDCPPVGWGRWHSWFRSGDDNKKELFTKNCIFVEEQRWMPMNLMRSSPKYVGINPVNGRIRIAGEPPNPLIPFWRVGPDGEKLLTPWERILPVFPDDVTKRDLSVLLGKLVEELNNVMALQQWDNSDDKTHDDIIEHFRRMEEQIWSVYFAMGRIFSDSRSMLAYTENGSSLVCDLAFDADCYLRRKDTPANTTAIGYEYLVLWGVHMAKRCRYEGDFGRMNRCKCCEGKAFLGSSSFHSLSGCNHAENFDDIHVPSEYMFVLKQWQSGPQGRIRAVRAANWFRKLHVLRPRSTLYEPV